MDYYLKFKDFQTLLPAANWPNKIKFQNGIALSYNPCSIQNFFILPHCNSVYIFLTCHFNLYVSESFGLVGD